MMRLRNYIIFSLFFLLITPYTFAETCPTSLEINAAKGTPKGWIQTAISKYEENASYDFVSVAKEGLTNHHALCTYEINHELFSAFRLVSVKPFYYPSNNLPLPMYWFEREYGEIACINSLSDCVFT